MAVKPQEILNTLNEEDRERIDELERYFDSQLMDRFKGDPVYIDLYYCNDRVFQELKRRYSGWNLTKISNLYNDTIVEFSPSYVNDDVR